jgi:hypothetical protein
MLTTGTPPAARFRTSSIGSVRSGFAGSLRSTPNQPVRKTEFADGKRLQQGADIFGEAEIEVKIFDPPA